MTRIPVIYREEKDRWVKGDRHVRPLIRRLLRGAPRRRSGMRKVVDNFLLGLDRLRIPYTLNPSFLAYRRQRKTISFGLWQQGLEGLDQKTPVIAAIGFPHPLELPDLCRNHNVVRFLQHSQWVLDLVRSAGIYDESIFDMWSAGIDTEEWSPTVPLRDKRTDVLIYSKVHWDKDLVRQSLLGPIRRHLEARRLTFAQIEYGHYDDAGFRESLTGAKVMVFLSAHESQGLACMECLSSDVPVLAWNPGQWLDPARFRYGRPVVPASSVPFFDARCGETFRDFVEFEGTFDRFFDAALAGEYAPRSFILDGHTIEKSTRRLLSIYEES